MNRLRMARLPSRFIAEDFSSKVGLSATNVTIVVLNIAELFLVKIRQIAHHAFFICQGSFQDRW